MAMLLVFDLRFCQKYFKEILLKSTRAHRRVAQWESATLTW